MIYEVGICEKELTVGIVTCGRKTEITITLPINTTLMIWQTFVYTPATVIAQIQKLLKG